MTTNALAYDKFSRAGMSAASFFAALPVAALAGALLLGPFMALAGLIGAPWTRLYRAVVAAGLPLLIVLAFLAWVAASAYWAKPPGHVGDVVAFAPFALLFLLTAGVARPMDQQLIRRAGMAAVAILVAIVAIEGPFNFPVGRELATPTPSVSVEIEPPPKTGISAERAASLDDGPSPAKTSEGDPAFFAADATRAATIALLCFWGVAASLVTSGWQGRFVLAALAGGVLGVSIQFGGGMNLAAFILGCIAAGLALIWPRATVSIIAQITAGGIVVAPLILPQIADLSAQGLKQFIGIEAPFGWQARAEMWGFAADRIKERLVLGWGFGGADQFTETYNLLGFTLPYIPRHPHNAPLQIWLETGAVGALLAAGALASFGRRAGAALANNRIGAAAAAGLLVTAAVFANVNMNAWAIWWWAAIAAAAALVKASVHGGA